MYRVRRVAKQEMTWWSDAACTCACAGS
jgi:hypothetical protein